MNIKDWTLVYNGTEAIMFTFLKPCQIHTNHTVQSSVSFAEMINHCTANSIHVNDTLINEILDAQQSSGQPIASNVAPALTAYLASGVEQPSAETLAKMQEALS